MACVCRIGYWCSSCKIELGLCEIDGCGDKAVSDGRCLFHVGVCHMAKQTAPKEHNYSDHPKCDPCEHCGSPRPGIHADFCPEYSRKGISLPTDSESRKGLPIATGVIDYFPNAIAEVALVSQIGNKQHNIDGPMRWDRSKSKDEADALMRHFIERGTRDKDGLRHTAKVAWRALAMLQKEIESDERTD